MPVKQDRRRPASRSRAASKRPQRRRAGRQGRGGRGGRQLRDLPPRVRAYVACLASVIVVALVVGSVFTVQAQLAVRSADADEARREAALDAARQQALNFTTIGYKSVDKDIDRVVEGATGDFKASYENNRKTIKKTVTKNKSTSKGEVLSAGIKSIDDDSATALVVVDASVTNVAHKKPTLQNYRMQFDLAKLDDGRWLVSGVEFVG